MCNHICRTLTPNPKIVIDHIQFAHHLCRNRCAYIIYGSLQKNYKGRSIVLYPKRLLNHALQRPTSNTHKEFRSHRHFEALILTREKLIRQRAVTMISNVVTPELTLVLTAVLRIDIRSNHSRLARVRYASETHADRGRLSHNVKVPIRK